MNREIRELTFVEGLNTTAPDQRFMTAGGISAFSTSVTYVSAKGTGAEVGDIFYNTTTNFFDGYNGSWHEFADIDSSQTFINKELDADDNNIFNIAIGSIKVDSSSTNVFLQRDNSGNVTNTKAVPAGTVVGTSDAQVLTNKTYDDAGTYKQVSTPSNPASGYNRLSPKSDNLGYSITSAGTEAVLGGGGGSTVTQEVYYLDQAGNQMSNLGDEIQYNFSNTFNATKNGAALTYVNWQSSVTNIVYVVNSGDPTKFYASVNCQVQINFDGSLNTSGTGLAIYKGGAVYQRGETSSNHAQVCTSMYLGAGEYFTVGGYSANIISNATLSHLTILATKIV